MNACVNRLKKPKWTTLIIIDSQAVKNTCTASVDSKGFCFYKATNGIKRHLAVDTLGFPFFTHCTPAKIIWAKDTFAPKANEQIANDGKSIKASVQDYDQSCQDFVSLVSAFRVEQGVVVGLEPMHNGQQSEIVTVQSLLEVLALHDVCFTLDALQTPKKPLSRSLPVATTMF